MKAKLPGFSVCLIMSLCSCKLAMDEPEPVSGSADFSSYVALGSSFTAGMTDGALYSTGQSNSFPGMLASVFSQSGGGTFRQPDVNSETGIDPAGNSRLQLYYEPGCDGIKHFVSRYAASTGDVSIWNTSIASLGPFNNLGVPGTKAENFIQQTFSDPILGNKFFSRFASNPGVSSLLSEAVSINPTFFTLLIGQEDVFEFARNGGDLSIVAPITTPASFASSVDAIVNTLKAQNADGAIANIPDPQDIPYFAHIPYNGLVLTTSQAQTLHNLYALAGYDFSFREGNNPFVMEYDSSGVKKFRLMLEGELVLLSASEDSICKGYGSYNATTGNAWAFKNKHVLDAAEMNTLRGRIYDFNQKLLDVCIANSLAYADLYAAFRQLNKGIIINGVTFSSEHVKGRIFSCDGFYPTGQGYAFIANLFIRAINEQYKSTLKEVDVNQYPGNRFP